MSTACCSDTEPGGAMQIHRVDERAVRETHPVGVEWPVVVVPDRLDVLDARAAVDAARIWNVIHFERADLHRAGLGTGLHDVSFEPVEGARRPFFGLKLNDRAGDVRRGLGVHLPEEPSLRDRPLEAGLLEDPGQLFGVRIDREVAQCLDELVEVDRRLARLDRIGFRPGRILLRENPLRERGWIGCLRVILTAAGDEGEERQRCEEWEGEAHGPSILRSAAAVHKPSACPGLDSHLLHSVRRGGGNGETRLP